MEVKYELIIVIVNEGFSPDVMDASREAGAKGGTIIHGRGTANKESEKFFGITIQPEKELVLLIVESKIKDNVLHSIYKRVGLDSEGQGIAFSLPVDKTVGLNKVLQEIKKEEVKEENK